LFNKHSHSQFGYPMYILKTQNLQSRVLTCYNISWPFSALTCKKSCIVLAYNIQPKFGRTFGTRSVSLHKPSASAECHNRTFGPFLVSSHVVLTTVECQDPTEFDLTQQTCILNEGSVHSRCGPVNTVDLL